MNTHRLRQLTLPCVLALLTTGYAAAPVPGPQATAPPGYSYATSGTLDVRPPGEIWRVLLDQSNLGGRELEMAELTLKAGTSVASHTHQSLEIIYVLGGSFGHEVNGHYYLLQPGMVGVVRPGDHVRHLVPKQQDARLLLIWVPGGEAERIIDTTKGTRIAPVSEIQAPR